GAMPLRVTGRGAGEPASRSFPLGISEPRRGVRLDGGAVLLPVPLHRRLAMGEVKEVVGRDVDGAHDPLNALAEVEDVDARRGLLEVAEEHPLARPGVRETRAVHGAVEVRPRGV